MNQVQIYTILQSHGFNEADAKGFLEALKQDQDVVTKSDLKDLELKMLKEFQNMQNQISGVLKEVNSQTWKFFTGLAVLATVFKLLSLWGK